VYGRGLPAHRAFIQVAPLWILDPGVVGRLLDSLWCVEASVSLVCVRVCVCVC